MRRLRARVRGGEVDGSGWNAERVVQESRGIQDQLVQWRRHLHENPEVGTETPETAAYVAAALRDIGLAVREGVGGHGVVAVLQGGGLGVSRVPGGSGGPARTFAVRADMDALSIQEETGLAFASKRPGKMHACGHDGHTAMALGAAKVLSLAKEHLAGNVKFIFQPAEEGPGGAKPMIEDGVLDDPKVNAIIGLHMGVLWDVPSGSVGVMPGPMMAAMDRFEMVVKGQGGHGAMPHQAIDAVCAASQLVTALQTIVSRRVNPLAPAVVTVGKFHAGTAFNIIAATAALEGTVRCLDEGLRKRMPEYIREIAEGVCRGMGAECELSYFWGYPVLENDCAFTEFFAGVARDVLGADRVARLPEPTMGGEDMAYYLREVPGTFFFLGSRPSSGPVHPHHNSKFDIDEGTLWTGAALLAETARRWLESGETQVRN